jgi:5'-3' exonuclease
MDILAFHARSKDVNPGIGIHEKVKDPSKYIELSKIKDWRKLLYQGNVEVLLKTLDADLYIIKKNIIHATELIKIRDNTIKLNKNNSIILFDSGYLFFYRFFATMKYLKFKYPDEIPPDILKDTFLDHLEKQILKTIKEFNSKNIIFCMDVPLKQIWRYEFLNEYKGERNHDISILPDIRKEISILLNKYGKCLTHPHLEADDIAYLCVQTMDPLNLPIKIITNDNDFLQMLKYKNVSIFNGGLSPILGDPYKSLWIKILSGDKSDNISGVCGKQKALKLLDNKQELDKFIILHKEKIDFNKKLIDMDNIPQIYKDEFNSKYKFIIYNLPN